MPDTISAGLTAPAGGNAPGRPRDGWIALDEQRPPQVSPLLLVTNNINAVSRWGYMSHVWLAGMIHYGDGAHPYPLVFDHHSERKVLGITHWRYAIPSEGVGLPGNTVATEGCR